ncbi:MAG: hypothetical protein WC758_03935 [Candidatus Woesearchaeota archaeon]|jgi:hypothetical protein
MNNGAKKERTKKKINELDVTNYLKNTVDERVEVLYAEGLTDKQKYNHSQREVDQALENAQKIANEALYVANLVKKCRFKIYGVTLEQEVEGIDKNNLNPIFGKLYAVFEKLNIQGHGFGMYLDRILDTDFSHYGSHEYALTLENARLKNVIMVSKSEKPSRLRTVNQMFGDDMKIKSLSGNGLNEYNLEDVTLLITYSNNEKIKMYLTDKKNNFQAELKPSVPFVNLTDIFKEKYEQKKE